MQKVKVNKLLNTVVISEYRGSKKVERVLEQNETKEYIFADGKKYSVNHETGEQKLISNEFQMSNKQKSRIKLIMKFALTHYPLEVWKFYTITTCQHLNRLSDQELTSRFSMAMENLVKTYKLEHYLWVAERQPSTGDLHFHIFCNGSKLPYDKVVPYLNKLFPFTGTNVVNGKKIQTKGFNGKEMTIEKLSMYLTKYVTKNDVVLHCRPSQISHGFLKLYDEFKYLYETESFIDVSNPTFEEVLQQCDKAIYSFANEYVVVYLLRPFSISKCFDLISSVKTAESLKPI
ncbi:MAG: hypothetical protein FADNKDHG_01470 [Holosporales bacterium]